MNFMSSIEKYLIQQHEVKLEDASVQQIHDAVAQFVMNTIAETWHSSRHIHEHNRCAYYFSAEYLTGRMVYNNLFNLGILEEVKREFSARGIDINIFEEIEDCALGNGGLGRLAACFLDSAATMNLPLDGYGILYKYGLFKQSWRDGYQAESADDWLRFGNPWARRRESHELKVVFADRTVRAVPYDMPVIGYKTGNIGTLRLWQSEAVEDFNFSLFNEQEYALAVREKNAAENITRVLYPNDSTRDGKKLRLRQQYFLSSASLQDILFRFKQLNKPISEFPDYVVIQLNDTHPTVSIPELMRLLMNEGLNFSDAFDMVRRVFAYTNHTVMQEALEKWDVDLFKEILPGIFDIIYGINAKLCGELMARGLACASYAIIQDNRIHMANLAVYCSRNVNGVAAIHTEILKKDVLKNWYNLYPERFQNKTNGITQRRWLGLCNPGLSRYIEKRVGNGFMTDLSLLSQLTNYTSESDIDEFISVKFENKKLLSAYIEKHEGVIIPPDFVYDVQIKRMHEYKRQLMNILAVLDIYYSIKDGNLQDFPATAFIFGAKAAPGYIIAKTVIKFINSVAAMINSDSAVNDRMRVVFVQNYNCSYAEKLIPAADISEQISPAGTEASGTGNMKLMLNGAVTLGTYDGANIEIVNAAGEENNYIFGNSVDVLNSIRDTYNPHAIYESEPRVKRVLDTLINGTLDDGGTGAFRSLYDSLVNGSSWQKPDYYFVIYELLPYIDKKLEAIYDTRNKRAFAFKCLMNTASSGYFSSDRTINEYANDIWMIKPIPSDYVPVLPFN